MEEFACPTSEFDDTVLYRAGISANDDGDCGNVISRISDWVDATVAITVQGNRLDLNPICPLEIDSFEELPECPTPFVTDQGPLTEEALDLTIIIAAGAGGGGLLLFVCVVIVGVVCCVKKAKKKE